MTPKQADFIALYLETQNASEAYKRAYNSNARASARVVVSKKIQNLQPLLKGSAIRPFYTSDYH